MGVIDSTKLLMQFMFKRELILKVLQDALKLSAVKIYYKSQKLELKVFITKCYNILQRKTD